MSGAAPAGWYPDSTTPNTLRWWDGQQWTSHVSEAQPAAAGPPQQAVPARPPARMSKREARGRVEELEALVEKHGLRQFGEIDAYRARVDAEIAAARAAAETEHATLRAQWDRAIRDLAREHEQLSRSVESLRTEVEARKREVVNLREAASLQDLGIFDYEHPAESSADLAGELEVLRGQIKATARDKRATTASEGFTFNNSVAKGRKFVDDMSKILLRAYNAEAENCVKTMRAGHLSAAQQRLSKVAEQIERQGKMIDLRITPNYQQLRMKELALASRHLQAVQREKELERERRAELREQRKAEQELAREHERLEKEKNHYQSVLGALEASGDTEGADRMRQKIADVDRAIDDVDYRAANIRAGYVYVISNIGAFGENMVKIGMTRRLDPMDRVNELGDASVPFRFDVHALFFADDAVGIENMLHTTFAPQRVNKVNLRREYFRVTPAEVLEALKAHHVEVVEYTVDPVAEEYRASTVPEQEGRIR